MATTTAFYAMIKPSLADIADIAAINQNTDKIDEIMHGSQVSIAPAYDPANTYNTDDLAMHDFLLYKCLADGTTGTWDGTKWTRTTAAEEGGGGGGGSTVEANPAATPTDTLNTIGINGTVYDIPGSGGGGGGGGTGLIEGLDYDRASALTLPDFTGYSYTPTENGVIMLNTYGQVGGVIIETTGRDALNLTARDDTWTTAWAPVDRGRAYTLKRSASASTFPSGSWLSFIPWKAGAILAPMIYSEAEREIGAWIDSKPLYQKSYVLTSAINITNSGYNITSLIDNSADIEQIVGVLLNSTASASEFGTEAWAGWDGNGGLWAYSAEESVANTITLRYTKTTDTPGSGNYGALGVPMAHYDGNEKVIGTYFGETLYEISKTGNFSTGTFTAITLSDNIDTLVSYEAALYYSPTNQWLKLPYFEGGDRVYLITNDNLAKIVSNSAMQVYTKYAVTLRYTKATT